MVIFGVCCGSDTKTVGLVPVRFQDPFQHLSQARFATLAGQNSMVFGEEYHSVGQAMLAAKLEKL